MKPFPGFILEGRKYLLNDTIIVKSGDKHPFFVAEIIKIEGKHDEDSDALLTVRWFYLPEEIEGGRRNHHGRDELLRSNHKDRIHVNCVDGPCRVLSFMDYVTGKHDKSKKSIFYAREFYCAKEKEVVNDHLKRHCVCNQPENPDKLMIQCDGCDVWYHVHCLGVVDKELGHATFLCRHCGDKGVKIAFQC